MYDVNQKFDECLKGKHMKQLQMDVISSPINDIVIVVDDEQMCSLDYADYSQRMMTLLERRYGSVQLIPTTNPFGYSD